MDAVVQWIAPPRMWTSAAQNEARQPALLRFASDSFMTDFANVLNNQPERLMEWRAEPETWRLPMSEPKRTPLLLPAARRFQTLMAGGSRRGTGAALVVAQPSAPPAPTLPLKLYHPAHQRYYLLSAALVCRLPGLPDRMMDVGAGEQVTFVVRRLRPKTPGPRAASFKFDLTTCDEYALVDNAWVKAAGPTLANGEEQLPMFPFSYSETDGRKRRLLSALVPVSNREKYAAAHTLPLTPPAAGSLLDEVIDPRKALFMRDVADVWRSLVTRWNQVQVLIKATDKIPNDATPTKQQQKEALETQQKNDADYLSWLILADFDSFLETHMPHVWKAMNASSAAGLNTAETMLYNTLMTSAQTVDGISRTLAQALIGIRGSRDSINTTPQVYRGGTAAPWPNFRFPLQNLSRLVNQATTLDDQVKAALPVTLTARVPPLPLAARLAKNDMSEPLWFVVRCVFERPNCGPLMSDVISEATQPFQMASFFDADAPARPIRIPLPIDISPAGLRKYDRNTAVMLSDALCAQVSRAQSMSLGDLVLSVLPWPFHKDLPSFNKDTCDDGGITIGMICSLSIPIITICALILLIIMVSLFDMIFHWIPFFLTCFPIPNFNAKEGA